MLVPRDGSVRSWAGTWVSPELPAAPALALLAVGPGAKGDNVGLVQKGHFWHPFMDPLQEQDVDVSVTVEVYPFMFWEASNSYSGN